VDLRERTSTMSELSWVPDACTLPNQEQPLRVAEFTELFASALKESTRPTPSLLRLVLTYSNDTENTLRDLVARESTCCAFFDFTITHSNGELVLDVGVSAGHEPVLNALADQAISAVSTRRG
jgi:hypothetical protein